MGFEKRPREIADRAGLHEDDVRQYYFTERVQKKIDEIRKNEIPISSGITGIDGSDNHIILANDIKSVFNILTSLTNIKIRIKNEKYVPVEIALDARDFGEDLLETDLINNKVIISFLKNDILNPYRSYYEEKYHEKIKNTYVVLTPQFYEDLKTVFDTRLCDTIKNHHHFFTVQLDKLQQRGKVLEFLGKLPTFFPARYDRIDELYVEPAEYGKISSVLEEKRLVFITGSAELGKTFTAIKLLWKYYNDKGYEPVWIKGRNEL